MKARRRRKRRSEWEEKNGLKGMWEEVVGFTREIVGSFMKSAVSKREKPFGDMREYCKIVPYVSHRLIVDSLSKRPHLLSFDPWPLVSRDSVRPTPTVTSMSSCSSNTSNQAMGQSVLLGVCHKPGAVVWFSKLTVVNLGSDRGRNRGTYSTRKMW
ncbi:hypothetical protein V1478_015287 [Vespula squamosa]|uniref:Uncharacterized protein n=1 Tax=Vespula squamosa TaxID=30214 RepID=A0ABD2A4N7_VESSQ